MVDGPSLVRVVHGPEYVLEAEDVVSEICNLVSEPSYLGHGSFEVSDAVSAHGLVGVDDGAPLLGEGSGAREVAAAEVPRDESDYGGIVHDMDRMFFS